MLPLFPLNTVLFPGGHLSLQVFEVRYLDMVRQCIENNSAFGIVTLTSGSEVRLPGKTETFSQFGTLVRITESSSQVSGLYHIQCEGTKRFRIFTVELQRHGLWVANDFEMIEDDKEIVVPEELKDTADALETMLVSMKRKGIPENELSVTPPWYLNNCGWVANRWSELLPLTQEQKQNLLALDNPILRLEIIQDELNARGMLGAVLD